MTKLNATITKGFKKERRGFDGPFIKALDAAALDNFNVRRQSEGHLLETMYVLMPPMYGISYQFQLYNHKDLALNIIY